ncbi:MAG: hypothetical protein GY859_04425 [Desulfobacterales bacterium]|nr:hypothetical protein [Desulfobacterales bacterium]
MEEEILAHEMVRHDLINPALQYAIAPGWIRQSGALGKWRDIQIDAKERNAVQWKEQVSCSPDLIPTFQTTFTA